MYAPIKPSTPSVLRRFLLVKTLVTDIWCSNQTGRLTLTSDNNEILQKVQVIVQESDKIAALTAFILHQHSQCWLAGNKTKAWKRRKEEGEEKIQQTISGLKQIFASSFQSRRLHKHNFLFIYKQLFVWLLLKRNLILAQIRDFYHSLACLLFFRVFFTSHKTY